MISSTSTPSVHPRSGSPGKGAKISRVDPGFADVISEWSHCQAVAYLKYRYNFFELRCPKKKTTKLFFLFFAHIFGAVNQNNQASLVTLYYIIRIGARKKGSIAGRRKLSGASIA